MMGKRALLTALALILVAVSGSCFASEQDTDQPCLTVYFPNWNIYSDSTATVYNLPWDRLDRVNHAFWKIVPSEGGYAVQSTDPWADTDENNPSSHFAAYAACSRAHPDVEILLSIGGWTKCGFFSEMALTESGRASFIQSCVETLEKYPFLSGIDIDWEYPGVAREGGGDDEGNPVKGDDRTNYTLLLKEMRVSLDAHFGEGKKLLTVCASAAYYAMSMQDYAALHPYVDMINLMTYDMAGSYNAFTGHHSPLLGGASCDSAVKYMQSKGVPNEKISIGAPLYSHGWRMSALRDKLVGAPAAGLADGDLTWRELHALELAAVDKDAPGWHAGYDEQVKAAYLWNDDPESADYLKFYTYDSAVSLADKLSFIREKRLGGLIVWQVHGDSFVEDWPMITQMYTYLHD